MQERWQERRHEKWTVTRALRTSTAALTLLTATAVVYAAPPRTFSTPREAVDALVAGADHNDGAQLLTLFGSEANDMMDSGDPAADQSERAEFARLAHQHLQIEEDSSTPNRVTFVVGDRDWPFPVPLVRRNGRWQFDSAHGRLEILARRVGRNEMTVMEVCRGYVEAQLGYATVDRDANGVLEYAQRIVSTPGKQDGLYQAGASESFVPKGFAAAASTVAPDASGKREPYHGYYFRILKAQGPAAPGGALDYVVKGRMIGGFALVAWPAEYGTTGVKTLIVSHHGIVYEKDLGPQTETLARRMTRFNPDRSWHPIDKE
jgi:hypothetical protein